MMVMLNCVPYMTSCFCTFRTLHAVLALLTLCAFQFLLTLSALDTLRVSPTLCALVLLSVFNETTVRFRSLL